MNTFWWWLWWWKWILFDDDDDDDDDAAAAADDDDDDAADDDDNDDDGKVHQKFGTNWNDLLNIQTAVIHRQSNRGRDTGGQGPLGKSIFDRKWCVFFLKPDEQKIQAKTGWDVYTYIYISCIYLGGATVPEHCK